MVAVHGAEPPAVAAAYDFSSCGLIIDVGGASGNLLGHVLAAHSRPRGVLFDLPQAMTEAPARLQALGVADRVTIQGGNAFDSVPPGADAYLLSHVIHDWNEDKCLTILRNCRAAMTTTTRLLIIELVLREGNAPGFGSSDMVMMALTGGAERTAREFASLLARAGLTMTRVLPTNHQREHRRSAVVLGRTPSRVHPAAEHVQSREARREECVLGPAFVASERDSAAACSVGPVPLKNETRHLGCCCERPSQQ